MSSTTGGSPEFSPSMVNGASSNQAASAEIPQSQEPEIDAAADQGSLLPPPQRPVRPAKPEPAAPAKASAAKVVKSLLPEQPTAVVDSAESTTAESTTQEVAQTKPADQATPESIVVPRQHPISTPSEPRQYRAIGLVRGCYVPSEKQFNLGVVKTDAEEEIDAVLLGRVTSLIKNHIDLTIPHLWVVYPRTREQSRDSLECDLHLQIVGVWEPETLNREEENPSDASESEVSSEALEADTASTEATTESSGADIEAIPTTELPDNYFSIRGEILRYSEDTGHIVVNIVQVPKQSGKPPKSFRLTVQGTLEGKTVGYFWDLDVQRQGTALVLESGTVVGIVPPKKRKPGDRGKTRRPVKRFKGGNRSSGDRPKSPNYSTAERPVPSGERRKARPESSG